MSKVEKINTVEKEGDKIYEAMYIMGMKAVFPSTYFIVQDPRDSAIFYTHARSNATSLVNLT